MPVLSHRTCALTAGRCGSSCLISSSSSSVVIQLLIADHRHRLTISDNVNSIIARMDMAADCDWHHRCIARLVHMVQIAASHLASYLPCHLDLCIPIPYKYHTSGRTRSDGDPTHGARRSERCRVSISLAIVSPIMVARIGPFTNHVQCCWLASITCGEVYTVSGVIRAHTMLMMVVCCK